MSDTHRDPEEQLERTTQELEERLDRLDDHIEEAEHKAESQSGLAGEPPLPELTEDAGGAEPPEESP